MPFFQETFRIFRTVFFPALAALIVSTIFDQLINQRLEILLQTDEGPGSSLWTMAALSMLNGYLFPVFAGFCCLFGLAKAHQSELSLPAFAGRTINQLYVETLRAWGSILAWGLLFIIPGLIRMVQLVFVPYVVCFQRSYHEGHVDALRSSRAILKRNLWRTLGAMTLFVVVIPMLMTSALDSRRSYLETPLSAIGCSFLDLIVLILSTQVFFRLFKAASQEPTHEPVLSVE